MFFRLSGLFFSLCSVVLLVSPPEGTAHGEAPASGWSSGDSPGVPLPGAATYSSVVAAEIDAVPGLDVAVASSTGYLSVFHSDGTLLWQSALPNAACTETDSINKVLSSPAVGDIYGDGTHYVIVGYGGIGGKACGGGVVAFDGRDGEVKWHFNLKKFASSQHFSAASNSVFSTPALADVDGDGTLEIGFGSYDQHVYLLNANGSPRWYYHAADTVWSSGAFAATGTGSKAFKLIIGTDITGNSRMRPPTHDGGYLYAFNATPKKTSKKSLTRYSFRDRNAYVWQRETDQAMYASPVMADALPETPGKEVISTSGCYFPQGSQKKRGDWIQILRLKDGKVLRKMALPGCTSSQPAIGDIDNNGTADLVISTSGSAKVGGDGAGHLVALEATTGATLWDVRLPNHENAGSFSSPVLADLNGDGSLEVVMTNGAAVCIYRGTTGAELHCMPVSGTTMGTPAVVDLLGTGEPVIVYAGRKLYAWKHFNDVIPPESGSYPPYAAPWPMSRGNPMRTGNQ